MAVILSALVGIFIEPFAGDVPIVCGGGSIDGVVEIDGVTVIDTLATLLSA